ncbi:MAG: nucleoside-diphosphate kinase [Candidatus Nanohaloarchaea archaeon]
MKEEYTFVMLKPDTLHRGLESEVFEYFLGEGLRMPLMTESHLTHGLVAEHYSHVPDDVQDALHEYFDDEDVVVGVLEGEDAVSRTRQIVGDDFRPEKNSTGTIRGDAHNPESPLYSEEPNYDSEIADDRGIPLYNFIHASGDFEEAQEEIRRFLGPQALNYL